MLELNPSPKKWWLEYVEITWNYYNQDPNSAVSFVGIMQSFIHGPLGRHRVHASWMYMAKLAAAKEFAYMKALKDRGLWKKYGWFPSNVCSVEEIHWCFSKFLCMYLLKKKQPHLEELFWIGESFPRCIHRFRSIHPSRMKDFLYPAPSIRIAMSWSCPLLGCSETWCFGVLNILEKCAKPMFELQHKTNNNAK